MVKYVIILLIFGKREPFLQFFNTYCLYYHLLRIYLILALARKGEALDGLDAESLHVASVDSLGWNSEEN